MKIGILTYHRSHNYGALLQAYALKTYVEQFDCQVEIIDYWPDYHEDIYSLIPFFKQRSLLGKIKILLLSIIGYSRSVKRATTYKLFMGKQLCLSKHVLYRETADLEILDHDIIIYGSDQIWRKSNFSRFKGFNDVYFGAYPKNVKHKVSYAASMGVINLSDDEKVLIAELMKNFNKISVREQQLKELVDSFGYQVPVVLDPIFLLDKKKWMDLIPHSKIEKRGKYIFFYQLSISKEAVEFTKRLSKYYGYDIIQVSGRVEPLLFGKQYFQTAGPLDFLSLINNAEIVVSTSFHGVAFSVLFEKQFFAMGMKKNSGRVENLLNELGIPERLSKADGTDFNLREEIDYRNIRSKIIELRKKSQDYLFSALKKDVKI